MGGFSGHPRIEQCFYRSTTWNTLQFSNTLTCLIRKPAIPKEEPEDIYSNAIDLLFPDYGRTYHGDAGSHVTYVSKRHGDIKFKLVDPPSQQDYVLFAHHVWNSGIQMAELISQAVDLDLESNDTKWDVTGERALELGAGV